MAWKRFATSAVLLASLGAAAGALPPSFVLGGFFEGGSSSTVVSSPPLYADAVVQGRLGWRQALGGGSWLAVTARGSVAPFLVSLQGLVDAELLNLELGLPAAAGTFILDAGAESSFMNQTGLGSWVQPGWSAAYRFPRSEGGLQAFIGCPGTYLYEAAGSDDHLSQALLLRLDQGTSVRLGVYGALRGAWELWTEEPAFDSSGTSTGALRQDWLLNLEAGARGFALYSVDWALDGSAGVRWSDASTSSTGYSALALPGGSRLNAVVKGSVSWTPSSHAGLSLFGTLQNDWYFERRGVNPDGSPAAANLDVLALGGGVKVDWTPDNAWFVVLQAGAERTFANRPDQDSWSVTLSAGIEYSF